MNKSAIGSRPLSASSKVLDTLRQTVTAHEAKHGAGLPTSEAPGWQAARELLVGINKALDGAA